MSPYFNFCILPTHRYLKTTPGLVIIAAHIITCWVSVFFSIAKHFKLFEKLFLFIQDFVFRCPKEVSSFCDETFTGSLFLPWFLPQVNDCFLGVVTGDKDQAQGEVLIAR